MAAPPARAAAVAGPLPEQPALSIIIPVLNEADCLDRTLTELFSRDWVKNHCEVIVSDGGSADASLDIARRYPCSIVASATGRALQMNAAAARAQAPRLLFLHADSQLPGEAAELLHNDMPWGFFHLRLSGRQPVFRLIETAINLRSGTSRVASGDQGLFFDRDFFDALGGYPQISLMEDIAITKNARKRTAPLVIKSPIVTSSRRWQQRGVVKTVLLMWWLRFAFWLGADPDRLHKFYYPQRG